jgi:hypothetical protein
MSAKNMPPSWSMRSQARNQQETSSEQNSSIFSSETSTNFHHTTYRYFPEDKTLHGHRCENLKSKE